MEKVYGIILTKQLGANLLNKDGAADMDEQVHTYESDMFIISVKGGMTAIPRSEVLTVFLPHEPMSMFEAREWIKQVKRI